MKYLMKRTDITVLVIFLTILAALFASCGGGGGTSGTSNAVTSGISSTASQAVLYVTDSFREDYAHVWATIYHVDLMQQSGTAVALFDNTSGVQIDLKTLRDSTGARFSFLGGAAIPEGTYIGISVTIGPAMQLFKNGEAVGRALPVDASFPVDAGGHPVLTLAFTVPKTLGSGTNILIVDFDLSRFIVRDSKIFPLLQEGDPSGCSDPNRHNQDDYRGAVSNLTGTAPDLTFTLTIGSGQISQVITNASTVVYGTSSLANGSMVTVTGTVDSTTGNLIADRLVILPAKDAPPPASVFGTASHLDGTAGTFTVTVTRTRGFVPAQTTVQIATGSTTTFISDSGSTLSQADFFTALTTTSGVIVDGSYDSASNTLMAVQVKIMDQVSTTPKWEESPHLFRSGVNRNNWGHGTFF